MDRRMERDLHGPPQVGRPCFRDVDVTRQFSKPQSAVDGVRIVVNNVYGSWLTGAIDELQREDPLFRDTIDSDRLWEGLHCCANILATHDARDEIIG
jgi:hypothetical protein